MLPSVNKFWKCSLLVEAQEKGEEQNPTIRHFQTDHIKSIIDDDERRYLTTLKKANAILRTEEDVKTLSGESFFLSKTIDG